MQQWANLEFGPYWRGLLSRKHDLDLDRNYASIARNVEFYGGAVGKRLGTQYVTGITTTVTGTATVVPPFILGTSILGTDRLGAGGFSFAVQSTSGLKVGQTVTVTDGTAARTGVGVIGDITGTTIVVEGLSFTPAPGDLIIVRFPLANACIDGLFHGHFRDELHHVIAACGDGLFQVLQAPLQSERLVEAFPATTVDVTWGSATAGTLTNVNTIRADGTFGEWIRIAGAGVGGGVYQGRVISVATDPTLPNYRTIIVSPATVTPPAAGAAVTLFQARVPGDAHFVMFGNLMHIVSENTPPVKVTPGLIVQRNGVLAPTVPIQATLVAGALSAAVGWTYRYKFRNSVTGQESEPSPEMLTPLVPVGQGVQLTLTASPDPQVDQIRIYRTTDGGAGAWYFLAEIPNPTTTLTATYIDNLTDDFLGNLMREFLDSVMPDGVGDVRFVNTLCLWAAANRLVGTDSGLGSVPFSDELDLVEGFLKPEAWPPENFLLLNYDDGDKPRANASFFDSLISFKERSVFRVLSTPPDIQIQPIIFRQDLTGVGTFNQKAVVVDQDELIFPGQDGFYLLERYQGVQQGFQSSRLSRNIDEEWARITPGNEEKAHAVFYRQRRQVRAFMPTDLHEHPSEMFVLQFEMLPTISPLAGAQLGEIVPWALWSVPRLPDGTTDPAKWTIGYSASCVAEHEGQQDIVLVGTCTGDVLRMDIGAAEAGVFEYDFDYATSWFTPSGKGLVCRARALDIVTRPLSTAVLTLEIGAEFQTVGTATVTVAPTDGFILGVGVLGVDRLGSSVQHRRDRVILLHRGEYQRIRFRERSKTALFAIQTFTWWSQTLPPTVQVETVVEAL